MNAPYDVLSLRLLARRFPTVGVTALDFPTPAGSTGSLYARCCDCMAKAMERVHAAGVNPQTMGMRFITPEQEGAGCFEARCSKKLTLPPPEMPSWD